MTATTPFDRVLALIQTAGTSEGAACLAAGLDRTAIAASRKRGGRMDLSTIEKFAGHFGVSVSQLLGEAPAATAPADPTFVRRPLARLALSPANERVHFDPASIDVLAEDIAHRGLLQPLIVYPDPRRDGFDLVADGGRRYRALVRLEEAGEIPDEIDQLGVPCSKVADEAEALEVTVVANHQREGVHFLDRAAALARLRDELAWDTDRIADRLKMGRRVVQIALQIHDNLDDDSRALALAGHLTQSDCLERVQAPKPAPLVGALQPAEAEHYQQRAEEIGGQARAEEEEPPAFLRRHDPAAAPPGQDVYAAERERINQRIEARRQAIETWRQAMRVCMTVRDAMKLLLIDRLYHWPGQYDHQGPLSYTADGLPTAMLSKGTGILGNLCDQVGPAKDGRKGFKPGAIDAGDVWQGLGSDNVNEALVAWVTERLYLPPNGAAPHPLLLHLSKLWRVPFPPVLLPDQIDIEHLATIPPLVSLTTSDEVADILADAVGTAKLRAGAEPPDLCEDDDRWVEDYGLNPAVLIEDAFEIKLSAADTAALAGGTFGQTVQYLCDRLDIPTSQAAE